VLCQLSGNPVAAGFCQNEAPAGTWPHLAQATPLQQTQGLTNNRAAHAIAFRQDPQ